MREYFSTLTCNLCGEKIYTKRHKSKLMWYIDSFKIRRKHLKEKHNMGFWEVMFYGL